MSYSCPKCGRAVLSRATKYCSYCGAQLPQDLFAHPTKRQAKTTLPHDYFGRMVLDERQKSYEATLFFSPDHKVSVSIDRMGMVPDEALKRAQDICEQIRVREPEYRNKIANEHLRLYNDDWRDGEILDVDGFMSRISLYGINVSPADFGSPCCATLYYNAGDLFGGHEFEVFLDGDFNYDKSMLAG